jgi:hypothetical protein
VEILSSVQNVEQATQLAMEFVKKYYAFAFPVAARKEASRWVVDFDISFFNPKYARVRLGESGTVEDFKITLGQLL